MKRVSTKEFIWYLVCGAVASFGLILLIFGIIGNHMPDVGRAENFVKQFQDSTNIDLRFVGLIIISVAVIVAVCALVFNARRAERDVEKKIRREQRLQAQASQTLEVKSAVEVVEEKQE